MAKPNYEYLEEERKKLWQKLLSVESQLNKKIDDELTKNAGDYSAIAKQASRKTSEYRNKSEESKNTILAHLTEVEISLANINQIQESVESLNKEIKESANAVNSKNDEIQTIYTELEEKKSDIDEDILKLETLFEDIDDLTNKLSKLEDVLSTSQDTSTKIEALHRTLLARKKEFDELYLEIFGYTATQDGQEIEVEGLKKKLDESYSELSSQITAAIKDIDGFKTKTNNDYDIFQKKVAEDYQKHTDSWELRYVGLEGRIEALLPNALTAGLSSAYSEKKNIEIEEYQKLNKAFLISICGLVIVSLLPLAVSYYSMIQNKPFEKVISDLPRLVLSFLPLYIPVLWVAYSSNRKMNLSKRLSEEYSHKEVLSKTFEGLSTQINNISNSKVSEDLKNKLLYNLLEASSENPGKLISDYNKADHPLMDALDKSVQLATAVEKLEKIPGFSKLAQKMNNKSKSLLNEENQKATKGLEAIEENSDED